MNLESGKDVIDLASITYHEKIEAERIKEEISEKTNESIKVLLRAFDKLRKIDHVINFSY